ncbi:hypothetical protein NG798_20260 [Ancylothrix sp. C2]|uniref:hypothetical protein n=1 Tax=Ancylothrix sp. D3o TaxID=2953691 RepID=UPI0021BB9697|nr:hypothetical protein [Ancylothrix sp. D3o]MCT7951285.1 hypothetical protein [Ancylothrix sp. D3o]MCT7952134.1 hypothetical protein [Ancylothrix sp. D3o]
MSQEVNRNSGGELERESNIIKSPWDEEEPPKNKSLGRRKDQASKSDDITTIAKGLAVGIMWSMSGLLDEENE